jgi:hypothetical protein
MPSGKEWASLARLLLWFGWPAWPLAIWTLWRWRKQIASRQWHRHLWLPLWFSLVSVGATISTAPADRALLLGLPAMATLAAFALPTLSRSMAALIDWFTLLFFSISALGHLGHLDRHADRRTGQACGQRGQAGAWVQPIVLAVRTAGGAGSLGGLVQFGVVACIAQPCPIWKSLVLPASGATLGWLLLLTLWLPLLNYATTHRSKTWCA